MVDQPTGERTGNHDGHGLAKDPIAIRSGPFVWSEPVRKQNHGSRPHASLADTKEEPIEKLIQRTSNTAKSGEDTPEEQGYGDELFRAPNLGEMSARNLQQQVAKKEDTGSPARLTGADRNLLLTKG